MFYLGITFINKVHHEQYLGKSERKPRTHLVYFHTFPEQIALDECRGHSSLYNAMLTMHEYQQPVRCSEQKKKKF